MYLIDTNVISEFRKIHSGKADARVAQWASATPSAQMYLSVVSVHEIEVGVLRMERKDAAQGRLFRQWLEEFVLKAFADRVLPVDSDIARLSAQFHVPDPAPVRDAFIAATAIACGMTVVTRNMADFARTGARLLNPWD